MPIYLIVLHILILSCTFQFPYTVGQLNAVGQEDTYQLAGWHVYLHVSLRTRPHSNKGERRHPRRHQGYVVVCPPVGRPAQHGQNENHLLAHHTLLPHRSCHQNLHTLPLSYPAFFTSFRYQSSLSSRPLHT